MAIINKINEKSGLVVGVIAVGLILFIVGGELMGPNSFFNSQNNEVGEIAGVDISQQEYQNMLQQKEFEYQIQYDQSIGENERYSIQEMAWNELIYKIAYKDEFDKLGLAVTEEELVDMVQGTFVHPEIKRAFGFQEGQEFDKSIIVNFLSNFDNVDPVNRQRWAIMEMNLPQVRLKEKYSNLMKLSVYTTNAEAENDYAAQNDKVELKYLNIPYYTVPDSAINVTNEQLKSYINKNKDKYKVEDGRSFDYVIFRVQPTAEDSLQAQEEIARLAEEFKQSQDDSSFVKLNSDNPAYPEFKDMAALPEKLKEIDDLQENVVYGPYLENGKYLLYKVIGSKTDSTYSAKASHILFSNDDKTEAEKILAEIKRGASFEEMAREHGTDGTASRGGDLGWFSEGAMVKPFESAVFGATKPGLLPNLVKTDFGYHIVKVTGVKTNKMLKVAIVEREILPSEQTKDQIYSKADQFRSQVADTASFNKALKESGLIKYSQTNAQKTDRSISAVSNAREIVRWAYTEAELGDVSPVFVTDDQYVVAILTGIRKEGVAKLEDVKDEVTIKVKNELKAAQIIEKLKSANTDDLDKMASTYGPSASVGTAANVVLSSSSIQGVGYDPIATGKAFGLEVGKQTEPFAGENSVVVLKVVNKTPATPIADYSQNKNSINQLRAGAVDYYMDQAIKEKAEIEDERYKYF
ncbi:MAG TPA: SurA N-terminal domain-containing protein [Cytophagaceae bacterium]